MRTLIFNGSPRKDGDTWNLLNEFITNIEGNVKLVSSYYDDISPCIDCRHCWKKPECTIADDMQEVYEYISECDNIIIASPLYFSELSGSIQNMLSRLQMIWIAKKMHNKRIISKAKRSAVIICSGGDGDYRKAEGTAKVLLKHMNAIEDYYGCIISPSTNSLPSQKDKIAIKKVHSLAKKMSKE